MEASSKEDLLSPLANQERERRSQSNILWNVETSEHNEIVNAHARTETFSRLRQQQQQQPYQSLFPDDYPGEEPFELNDQTDIAGGRRRGAGGSPTNLRLFRIGTFSFIYLLLMACLIEHRFKLRFMIRVNDSGLSGVSSEIQTGIFLNKVSVNAEIRVVRTIGKFAMPLPDPRTLLNCMQCSGFDRNWRYLNATVRPQINDINYLFCYKDRLQLNCTNPCLNSLSRNYFFWAWWFFQTLLAFKDSERQGCHRFRARAGRSL